MSTVTAIIKPINQYEIRLSSHPQFNEWQANVLLRQDNAIVADVRFVADPANWVRFGNINPNGASLIFVGVERYPWFIDMLRNEKPLFVQLHPATGSLPVRMILQTSSEPVGEKEGV